MTVVRMGDVLRLDRCAVNVRADDKYIAIGIRSFGRGIFHYEPCKGSELTKLPHFSFPSNAIALSNIKAWEGAIAITGSEDVSVIASSRFLFFVPKKEGIIDVRYLRYYFLSLQGLRQIGQASPGSADRNRTLSIRSFENIEVTVPGIHEQRHVADRLDMAISHLRRYAILRTRAKSLANQYAHTFFEAVNERAPLSTALRQSAAAVEVKADSSYPITGIYSFGRGLIRRPEILGSDTAYTRFTRLHAGQVVMSKLNAWEGALAVVNDSFDATYVSPEYPTFDMNASVDPAYLEHLLHWPDLWAKLTPRGSMVRRKRTTPSTFLATEVPLPGLPEQRRIARRLTTVRQAVDAGTRQNAQIAAIKSALFDAAFSSRL